LKKSFLQTTKKYIKNLVIWQLKKKFVLITKDTLSERSFVTVGARQPTARYKYLYLGRETIVTNSLKTSLNIRKLITDLLHKSGLVIILDSDLANNVSEQVVRQPYFINLEVTLPGTLEEYFKSVTSDARSNLKRIKKIGYTFVISKDKAWIDTFFDDYYLPSMVGRHSEDAAVATKHEIIAIINRPGAEFLKVFLGNQCLAAAITIVDGEKISGEKMGYLNGDISLLEQGIATAIYQFTAQRAFELGCKTINLGGTPPFLENGVLKYKAKWQPRFCTDIYYYQHYLLLNPANNTCYEFLRNTSLIVFGLNDSLIVLSSKMPMATNIQGNLLSDINSWFLLRPERAESYGIGMQDLPEHLRYWYEKVY
jgi:hypothetical protein